MFNISVNGSYPPDPSPQELQVYRQAVEDFGAGHISQKEMSKIDERTIVGVAGEMIVAGVEVISDGWIRWDDPASSILGMFDGIELQANKMPLVVDRVKWIKPVLIDDFRFLEGRSPVDVRPALVGPFTLAHSCIPDAYDGDVAKLSKDVARALNRELIGLEAAGARYISIEEPALVSHKGEIDSFIETTRILLENVRSLPMLITSGGDLFGIEEEVAATGYAGIGLDLVGGPDNDLLLERECFGSGRLIQAGIVDASNDDVEEVEQLVETILKLSDYHDPGSIWVAPNKGMRSLPRETAFAKLEALHRAVNIARREIARREQPGGQVSS